MIRSKTDKDNQSLTNTVLNVLSVAPTLVDPEDSNDSIPKIEEFHELDDQEILTRKYRIESILLDDKKYLGRKGSRNNLKDEEEESKNDDADSTDGLATPEYSFDDSDDDEELTSSEETDSNSEVSVSRQTNVKDFNEADIAIPAPALQKEISVHNQVNIWENLLEIRIQLQKVLINANKLSGVKEMDLNFDQARRNIEDVLDKLLCLQLLLLKRNSETKKVAGTISIDNDNGNTSHTKVKRSNDEDETEAQEIPHKRMKLNNYENTINSVFTAYIPYRNSVIEKWNDKTRIVGPKSNTQIFSVVSQVENILNDKQKLIQKTQLKRMDYNISKTSETSEKNNEYDPEIFDDNDFYHQLLRAFIEIKTTDTTDPIKLSRKWIELQNVRKK
ncbi:aatf protein apoptosis antagonizing transcription factor [Holotrichia oblita]|uniref:Aatf protein apoptosis antagonizing transcription factor n=1 Tax=Holotrichia oblita TaxID=644536 RepID=A0ACB9TN35_HOLOL|nr:aatf protein apoptosis antagonizing transcription factor [Holotrichia oblita]